MEQEEAGRRIQSKERSPQAAVQRAEDESVHLRTKTRQLAAITAQLEPSGRRLVLDLAFARKTRSRREGQPQCGPARAEKCAEDRLAPREVEHGLALVESVFDEDEDSSWVTSDSNSEPDGTDDEAEPAAPLCRQGPGLVAGHVPQPRRSQPT